MVIEKNTDDNSWYSWNELSILINQIHLPKYIHTEFLKICIIL